MRASSPGRELVAITLHSWKWLLNTLFHCTVLSPSPFLFLIFWGLYLAAWGILVPQPEIKLVLPALGARGFNLRTTRKVPEVCFLASLLPFGTVMLRIIHVCINSSFLFMTKESSIVSQFICSAVGEHLGF